MSDRVLLFSLAVFQGGQVVDQCIKIAMRILADIHGFLVDQAVGQQEDGDAKSGCRQVFRGIVSHHHAFFWFYLCSGQDILIVGRVRLAVVGIFVGCIEFKVFRFQSCPANARFGGDGREERVGGKNDPETEGTGKLSRWRLCVSSQTRYVRP